MKESSALISQVKFLVLMLQIILVAAIYETRVSINSTFHVFLQNQFLFSSLNPGTNIDSLEFIQANNLLTLYCFLFALFGVVEFFIIFSGKTLFNSSMNLILVSFHVAGIVCLLNFQKHVSHYNWLIIICALTSFLPLVLESGSAVYTSMNYRRIAGSGRT